MKGGMAGGLGRWCFLLGLAGAVFLLPAAAFGLRVGNELIREGDTKLEVLEVMGPPVLRERVETAEGGTIGWRYYYRVQSGATEKDVILHFRGGRIRKIEEEIRR